MWRIGGSILGGRSSVRCDCVVTIKFFIVAALLLTVRFGRLVGNRKAVWVPGDKGYDSQVIPPRGALQNLVQAPLFAARRRLLVGSHNGRINHQIWVLPVPHQLMEDHAACSPSGRTAYARSCTCHSALEDHASGLPGSQHQEYSVDEDTVVRRRSSHRLHAPRQQPFNPKPLRIAQLISANAHTDRTTNQSRAA